MNKPEIKKKKIEQFKLMQLDKKEATKRRIENAEIFKYKDAEARVVCAKCKNLVVEYEYLVAQETRIKAQLLKRVAPLLFMMKFGLVSSNVSLAREKN